MEPWLLVLGNRNYSSWSMRAWLAMKQTGVEFEEIRFHLGETDVRRRIRERSPTGRVPALHHGERVIWDSLAICEYLAEVFPRAGLWPVEAGARARARSVTAEMHAGFAALRASMPFNVRRESPGKGRSPEAIADVERVLEIWRGCREAHGGEGPYLFGGFGIADAFYAPVVSRLETYAVDPGDCADYVRAVWEHPHVGEWREDARAESWVEPEFDL